eukprot:GEZU01010547.1.p1 GENE.GEZU01010547.1~~GEZU01010547.1.p1  ORF type:complete len:181 (-),score=16.51 GEZU01010547.1:136-639(-)
MNLIPRTTNKALAVYRHSPRCSINVRVTPSCNKIISAARRYYSSGGGCIRMHGDNITAGAATTKDDFNVSANFDKEMKLLREIYGEDPSTRVIGFEEPREPGSMKKNLAAAANRTEGKNPGSAASSASRSPHQKQAIEHATQASAIDPKTKEEYQLHDPRSASKTTG